MTNAPDILLRAKCPRSFLRPTYLQTSTALAYTVLVLVLLAERAYTCVTSRDLLFSSRHAWTRGVGDCGRMERLVEAEGWQVSIKTEDRQCAARRKVHHYASGGRPDNNDGVSMS
jgi:hypothetical protein